ncbi:MAG: cytidine deaminase [Planctomycetota bacterium]
MRDLSEALAAARDVRGRAHAEHSGFRVGAVVEDAEGTFTVGCNVESASYGLTLCAERAALSAWIAAGRRRAGNPVVRVVLATYADRPTAPCGACRQWLAELAPNAEVVSVADALPPAGAPDAGRAAGARARTARPDGVHGADLEAAAEGAGPEGSAPAAGGGGASLPKSEGQGESRIGRWTVAELLPDSFGATDLPGSPTGGG